MRRARPRNLYFAANAPNPENPADEAECAKVRALLEEVDWPCEVTSLFREKHLSAKESITEAITWFFNNVEEGIILEDDCVVSDSFFRLASELLEKYRDEPRIMQIGASNFQRGEKRSKDSYYFSRNCYIWGWATWRRAWEFFELDPDRIGRDRFCQAIDAMFSSKAERSYWKYMFDYVQSGKIDTWDYQWMFNVWLNDGLAVVPCVNSVSNVGFGQGATNTTNESFNLANLPVEQIRFPIVHPDHLSVDERSDFRESDTLRNITRSYRSRHLKIRIARYIPVTVRRQLKRLFGV